MGSAKILVKEEGPILLSIEGDSTNRLEGGVVPSSTIANALKSL